MTLCCDLLIMQKWAETAPAHWKLGFRVGELGMLVTDGQFGPGARL